MRYFTFSNQTLDRALTQIENADTNLSRNLPRTAGLPIGSLSEDLFDFVAALDVPVDDSSDSRADTAALRHGLIASQLQCRLQEIRTHLCEARNQIRALQAGCKIGNAIPLEDSNHN